MGVYGGMRHILFKLLAELENIPDGPEKHRFFHTVLPPIKYHLDETVAVLAWHAHNNYYHWLVDVLSRYHLLEKSGISIDKYVINGDFVHKFNKESLALLGIPKEKIIFIEEGNSFHISASKLIITSIPSLSHTPRYPFDFLREKFLPNEAETIPGFERIYISRDDSFIRRVLNEDKVMEILDKKGFKKVLLAPLAFEEKIKIFHSAKIVIGPHGAGLTNLAFCQPGTKVIEFFYKDYPPIFKRLLCNYLNFDYYSFICNGEPHETLDPNSYGYYHIHADIEKLTKILNYLEI